MQPGLRRVSDEPPYRTAARATTTTRTAASTIWTTRPRQTAAGGTVTTRARSRASPRRSTSERAARQHACCCSAARVMTFSRTWQFGKLALWQAGKAAGRSGSYGTLSFTPRSGPSAGRALAAAVHSCAARRPWLSCRVRVSADRDCSVMQPAEPAAPGAAGALPCDGGAMTVDWLLGAEQGGSAVGGATASAAAQEQAQNAAHAASSLRDVQWRCLDRTHATSCTRCAARHLGSSGDDRGPQAEPGGHP